MQYVSSLFCQLYICVLNTSNPIRQVVIYLGVWVPIITSHVNYFTKLSSQITTRWRPNVVVSPWYRPLPIYLHLLLVSPLLLFSTLRPVVTTVSPPIFSPTPLSSSRSRLFYFFRLDSTAFLIKSLVNCLLLNHLLKTPLPFPYFCFTILILFWPFSTSDAELQVFYI